MTEQVAPGIAAAGYDEAERVYLDLLRRERHADLGDAASKVVVAAKLWTSAAYAAYFHVKDEFGVNSDDAVPAEIEAEKAEVLADLWIDIAKAHRGAAVARI